MKSESEVTQSCPTLSDPMDCSPPGSSVRGIFQARVLECRASGCAAASLKRRSAPARVRCRSAQSLGRHALRGIPDRRAGCCHCSHGRRIDWLDLLAVQGTLKSLLQHHSSKASIHWRSAFFTVQLSHSYMTTGKTIALT